MPTDQSECSIAATLAVIGDRWTLLILRDIFRGHHRFSEIQGELGVAKNLLSDRLNQLVDEGVLEKVQYQNRPIRFEYRLTAKGADLSASLMALMMWGDRWYSDDSPPTVLIHAECETPLTLQVNCPNCNVVVPPGQVRSAATATAQN